MQKMTQIHPVCLRVPVQAEYARSVRMLAANLAVLAGLTVDDTEDVRMASEEGFVWCCASQASECEILFEIQPGSISMEFSSGPIKDVDEDQTLAYAELILSAVCNGCEIDRAEGRLRLKKDSDGGING